MKRLLVTHEAPDGTPRAYAVGPASDPDAVRAVIAVWREDRGARDAEEERRREEGRAYRRKVKQLRRRLVAAAGGSSRRRRFAREFDRTAKDPVSLYAYLMSGAYALKDSRPGPKRRGGLC